VIPMPTPHKAGALSSSTDPTFGRIFVINLVDVASDLEEASAG